MTKPILHSLIIFLAAFTSLHAQHDHGDHDHHDPAENTAAWQAFCADQKFDAPTEQALLKVSNYLAFDTFSSMPEDFKTRFNDYAVRKLNDATTPHLCWADGTDTSIVESFHAVEEATADNRDPQFANQSPDSARWTRTANQRFIPDQGTPTILTWSLIPDGTFIDGFGSESASPSDLIAFLDGIYNVTNPTSDLTTRPWFSVFQTSMDQVASRTGITYIYEPNDDGAAIAFSAPGIIGTRGDLRVGGHPIDGNNGTLAYNFFPNSGDMVIDTNDNFYTNITSNSLGLRNVVQHENGHGIGLSHVCPINRSKLMEPNITRSFRGLQLAEVHALNRLYGDPFEKINGNAGNNTVANAAPITATQSAPFSENLLSIDDNSDTDFYLLSALTDDQQITIRVTPQPTPDGFVEGPQNSDGSCSSGTSFNFTTQQNLSVALLNSAGTLIDMQNTRAIGEPEEITNLQIPADGDYIIRVTGSGENQSQLYTLDITPEPSSVDPLPQAPDNLVAEIDTNGSAVVLNWQTTTTPGTVLQVERRNEVTGTFTEIGRLVGGTSTFTDSDPLPGVNHFYRISALSPSEANAAPSGEVNILSVDLSADSYTYDFGTDSSPLEAGSNRIFPGTDGDVRWTNTVSDFDANTSNPDAGDRDLHFLVSNLRELEMTVENAAWRVTVRQGAATVALQGMRIFAESVLIEDNISTSSTQLINTTFVVKVADRSLTLGFDATGDQDFWVVNEVTLERLSPFETFAFEENLPQLQAGRNADPDNDGLVNIQEYFFGLEPLAPNGSPPLSVIPTADGAGEAFSFLRDPTAEVGDVTFQTSSDLVTWNPLVPPAAAVSTEDEGTRERVTIQLPEDAEFVRIGLDTQ